MATQFTFETVDGTDGVRGQSSLALDKNGIPHIAYVDGFGNVRLAHRNSGAWSIERVPSGIVDPSDEDRVCLEIDSHGNPQIAFLDGTNHFLIHGVKMIDNWTFTPVPTHFRDARSVLNFSFKLHPGRVTPELRDTPHFAYKDMSGPSLGYTRMFGGRLEAATRWAKAGSAITRANRATAASNRSERRMSNPPHLPYHKDLQTLGKRISISQFDRCPHMSLDIHRHFSAEKREWWSRGAHIQQQPRSWTCKE